MGILNYTTKIKIEVTIAEIEKMLASSGATKILKEFDIDGNTESLTFVIDKEGKQIPFKLPMNADAVLQVLQNQSGEYRKSGYRQVRIVPQSMVNAEQAKRVGWRIIKDWLEAQLALYFLQMVKIEEIFLPYMYDEKSQKTMFELLEERGFNMQLEHSKKVIRND